MPSRHLIRSYDAPAFYHVYNRGAGKQKIFRDATDKHMFMTLLRRHLLLPDGDDSEPYPVYDAEIVAYCLMGNHYHLLLYQQTDPQAISGLMKSVATAYAMYFNRRHRSSGRLFEGPFRASRITTDTYLAQISRYIHLNPRTYRTYYWSSLRFYLGEVTSDLIRPERVLDVTPVRYATFLEDFEDRHTELKNIRDTLEL